MSDKRPLHEILPKYALSPEPDNRLSRELVYELDALCDELNNLDYTVRHDAIFATSTRGYDAQGGAEKFLISNDVNHNTVIVSQSKTEYFLAIRNANKKEIWTKTLQDQLDVKEHFKSASLLSVYLDDTIENDVSSGSGKSKFDDGDIADFFKGFDL